MDCAWQYQAITWTNVDIISKVFHGIHQRAISQVLLNPWQHYIFKMTQTSNITDTLIDNKIFSDVVGAFACRRCSNYIFILDLTPGFNGLGKDNYKMRQETFKLWDLVRLILEIWQYHHISLGAESI